MSGMCVPIGYCSLGGVERRQQREQEACLTGLPGCLSHHQSGFQQNHHLYSRLTMQLNVFIISIIYHILLYF